jgi:hypothetical protein
MTDVRISVIVTIVDGESALRNCLRALASQVDAPRLEIIVPWDASLAWADTLAAANPDIHFLPLGVLSTEKAIESPAGQHELFDRRRAAGLAAASGDIIAIIEDRGIPDADWAATVDRLHREHDHAVIGGAVECGIDRNLNWAVYFCDFSRYQLPFQAGSRSYVTDVNIAYKRAPLMAVRELWDGRYHETTVNWALTRSGQKLFLSPEMVVRQVREDITLSRVLHERSDWGRLFAYTRARECTNLKRIGYGLLSPLLPLQLFIRHALTQLKKRIRLGKFVLASPLVMLLLVFWSLGEMRGYLTGRP